MERKRTMVKELPERASVTVQLSGRKRNLIWQALYSKRASGGYIDRPEDALALEQIMASMRIINQYYPILSPGKKLEEARVRLMKARGEGRAPELRVTKKALPDSTTVKVQLNGRKRNIIWQALYGMRARGQYRDKPQDAYLVELIMASMRVISQYHPVETPAQQDLRRREATERRMRGH